MECPVGRWSSFNGDSCSDACPAGKYGIRSGQSNESSACAPVPDGFYMSDTLSAPVACDCNNRGTCNKLTGVCECTGGWESSSKCNTCDVKAWNNANGSCSACTSTHEAWPSKGSNFKCLVKCALDALHVLHRQHPSAPWKLLPVRRAQPQQAPGIKG